MPVPYRLSTPCYLSREVHNQKIRIRKQRRDTDKYSFINRTIINWNKIPAGLLAPFPCNLTLFERGLRKLSQTNDLKWSLKVATCELCAVSSVIRLLHCAISVISGWLKRRG
jgi:hypothetical protein